MRILAVTNIYPVAHAPDSGVFVQQQIEGLRQIGLEVDVLFLDRLLKGMRTYIGLRSQVRDRVTRFRPDVIHAMYGGVMAVQVTRAVNDTPSVVTFHGSDLLGEHLSGTLREMMAHYGVWCSIRAARRASRVVVVSKVLLDALPAAVDRSKVRVIPCGIDLRRFKPLDRQVCRNRVGWDPDHFHILFSGSRDPVKRPELAQAAVQHMNRFGLRAEIHYLRGVPNNQVAIWLNASDLVLLTSFHEGSPTIIKEALACNLPIVSVDVGDVAERIQGIEGCYIALSEPVDIAAKLSLVYNGPRRIAGRVKVQELSLERVSQRLKETYHEILTLSANESVDQEALWKSADRNGRNRFMSAFRAMKLGKSNGSRSIAD